MRTYRKSTLSWYYSNKIRDNKDLAKINTPDIVDFFEYFSVVEVQFVDNSKLTYSTIDNSLENHY